MQIFAYYNKAGLILVMKQNDQYQMMRITPLN